MTDEDKKPRENIAETVRDIVLHLGNAQDIDTSSYPLSAPNLMAIPSNRSIEDLTPAFIAAAERFRPLRRRGTARFNRLESLVDWANRHRDLESVLFAQAAENDVSLTAIINYDKPGPEKLGVDVQEDDKRRAGHSDHRGVYSFPVSREWKAWRAISGTPLTKDELADFLDDHALDILNPTPFLTGSGAASEDWENNMADLAGRLGGSFGTLPKLMQLTREFQINETSELSVTKNRDTGEASVSFTSEHKDAQGRPLKLPNLFLIAIPVFDRGDLYRLAVRFAYKKNGSSLKFLLTLHDAQRAFDDAFDTAAVTAAVATEMPLFYGRPDG